MVRTINNFPVTIEDVCNANTIYECDIPTLKGKPVRQQQNNVQSEYIGVPDLHLVSCLLSEFHLWSVFQEGSISKWWNMLAKV